MTSAKRTRSKSCGRVQSSSLEHEYRHRKGGMLFEGFVPVPRDTTIDPPPKACYNCWSLEHKRQFCTKPHLYNYCYNCGRRGVWVDECPRCARFFHQLNDNKKDWIYRTFYKTECYKTDDRKQSKGNNGDWNNNYNKNDYQSPSPNGYEENEETRSKLNKYNDSDFGWEPVKSYHSLTTVFPLSDDLFAYIRNKKIEDKFENDKIKHNVTLNLDETRMADRDSFEENSITSAEDFFKKDEEGLRSTGEPLQDILSLLIAVKHLPVKTQNEIILHYISERKKKMIEDEMQSVNKTKSP